MHFIDWRQSQRSSWRQFIGEGAVLHRQASDWQLPISWAGRHGQSDACTCAGPMAIELMGKQCNGVTAFCPLELRSGDRKGGWARGEDLCDIYLLALVNKLMPCIIIKSRFRNYKIPITIINEERTWGKRKLAAQAIRAIFIGLLRQNVLEMNGEILFS